MKNKIITYIGLLLLLVLFVSFYLKTSYLSSSILGFENQVSCASIDFRLCPSDYNITEPATELSSERTLRTATFDLGNGKRAQVSVSPDLFTHNPNQPDSIVFASSKGVKNGNSFIFDYLPQDTRVSFDLTKPSYTLTKGTHSFTLNFPTESSIAGTVLNDHQVSYPLSENATLVWTVDETNVKKEIFVKNNGTAHFEFAIDSNLVKTLSDNAVILSDGSKEIFRTEKPYLLTTDYSPLLNSVSLIQNAQGNYEYAYDESSLPEEYILDPSAGPNGPGTVATDSSNGGTLTWFLTSNILLEDGEFATNVAGLDENHPLTHYIIAKDFSFNITSEEILGVKVAILRNEDSAFDVNVFDDSVKIIKGGTITGSNKANTTLAWPQISEYAEYGGSSDLWGVTLTESDIEASNFGVAISVSCGSTCDDSPDEVAIGAIDYISITIYYCTTSCPSPSTPSGDPSIPYFLKKLRENILPPPPPEPLPSVTLQGSLFIDDKPNGVKDEGERNTLAGAILTLSGTLLENKKSYFKTTTVDRNGRYSFFVPKGEYFLRIDRSEADPTTLRLRGAGETEESKETKEKLSSIDLSKDTILNIPFTRTNVLPNANPCLYFKEINETKENKETKDGVVMNALKHLRTPSNASLLTTEDLTKKLMTRRDFFPLALKLHCVALASKRELPTTNYQLPTSPKEEELTTVLKREQLPYERTIKGKKYPDLNGFITEKEAHTFLTALTALTPSPSPSHYAKASRDKQRERGTRALTPHSALTLLLQSSFHNGHILLLKDSEETEESEDSKELLTTRFSLPVRDCLSSTPSRSQTLSFTDIPPNHPLAEEVYALLPLSNAPDSLYHLQSNTYHLSFLLPGTKRPTEFGITHGESLLKPNAPVSLLETIRALSIFSCLPTGLPAEASAKAGASAQVGLPTSSTLPPRDLFSNLPRNTSYPSRLFFTTQAIHTPPHLPLFDSSTIPSLRPPLAGLSLKEASPLLTQALLFTHLKERTLTQDEADKLFPELNVTVLRFLTAFSEKEKEGLSPTAYHLTPLKRSHLLHFLATILQNQTLSPEVFPSEAERWMERISR